MSETHNLRLTIAFRVKADTSEEATKKAEDAFKYLTTNKSYMKMIESLDIELDAYTIAEVKKL